ncbi:MAG: carboxy terminal-processing peptidase [Pseudomonadota bacterium]
MHRLKPLLLSIVYCAVILALTGNSLLWSAPLPQKDQPDIDSAPIARPQRVTYTEENSRTCVSIIQSLQYYHYSEKQLDDAMSSEILDRYMEMLDPSRTLFTQEDLKTIDIIRSQLDNAFKSGDLSPGYHIFNLYLDRSYDRLEYLLALLKDWPETMDFNGNDVIELNREKAPWAANEPELASLWKKELKNTILVLKLDKKSDQEITETLTKRYNGRLVKLSQTNDQDAFRAVMNAVSMAYDPHTQYFPPRVSEDFDIQMSLSLEGIGAVLQSEFEFTKVVRLITAGPAEKSKLLMPGDKIIGVGQNTDGDIQDVVGWRIDDVVKMIRGPKDTIVRLQIIPADQTGTQNARIINIKRDTVKLEEQAAHKTTQKLTVDGRAYTIGIIDIPTFYLDFKGQKNGTEDYRSTTRDVRKLLDELKAEGVDGLIIDLRDNGGGSLQEVNTLTGLFIKEGPTVQIKGRSGSMSRLDDPDPEIVFNGPLIVMTNRMSASASEIFAGAIRDYNRGILVGTRSFGKGTIQAMHPIESGQLKVTNAKFYRVSGDSTQNLGVAPDIEFPNVYNMDETGESSLKDALPWDTTKKASYKPYKDLNPVIEDLKRKHLERTANSPEFVYLQERYTLATDMAGHTTWSLNQTLREKEIDAFSTRELEIENRRLKAKGLPVLASIKDLKKTDEPDKTKEDADKTKEDPLLTETGQMMGDFIEIARTQHYRW